MKPYSLRNKAMEKFRFFIANQLDKTNLFCWADLAMFGLGYGIKKLFSSSKGCRKDSKNPPCNRCYCGKFFNGEIMTKEMAESWTKESLSDLPF